MREALRARGLGLDPDFRWRGGEVSRLEAFSDAVFAFALTLLVVSLEVPDTFAALRASLWSFLAFAATFAILLFIWYQHYVFFRRYGLEDAVTVWLNAGLLFVVLFYIYPLKFLMNFLLDLVTGGGAASARFLGYQDVVSLMVIYAVGYSAVWTILALLYRRAAGLADALELTPRETVLTRASVGSCLIQAGIAGLSVVLVLALPPTPWSFFVAGCVYWLIGPLSWAHGRRVDRRVAALAVDGPAA